MEDIKEVANIGYNFTLKRLTRVKSFTKCTDLKEIYGNSS